MAHRIYLPSTGTAPVNPAVIGAWNETANADASAFRAVSTKISSSPASKTVAKGTGAGTRALVRRYLYGPIAAQTISGQTVKGQIRALESAANDNLDIVSLGLYVVSNDGSTVRGTLLALGNYVAALEFGTALTNRKIADGDAISSVTATGGDWIVIELGITNTTVGSSVSGDLSFGDNNASDLGENTTDTTALNPWIEFSGTITLQSTLDSSKSIGMSGFTVMYRDNLHTMPDNLDDAYWTLLGDASIAATNVTDPDGWPLAESILVNPGAAIHQKGGLQATVAGKTYDLEIWAKGNGTDSMEWGTYDDVDSYRITVITPPTTWTKYTISGRTYNAAVTDARHLVCAKVSGASGGTFSISRVLMRETVVTRTLDSSQSIGISGSIDLDNPLAISSSKGVGISGAITINNPLVLDSTKQIAIGGTTTISVLDLIDSSVLIPVGGAIDLSVADAGRTIDSAQPIGIGGQITLANPLTIDSSVMIPVGGSVVIVTAPVVVTEPTTYGGGGRGKIVSGRARREFAKRVAEALYRPEPQPKPRPRPAAQPRKKEEPLRIIEAAVRRLRLPEPERERVLEELQRPDILPSLRGIAIVHGSRSHAEMGRIDVSAGSAVLLVPIVTRAEIGVVIGEGIQNPTEEELIQMLVEA